MLFLTEGDSAAGSMISCRDVNTQAIFSLRENREIHLARKLIKFMKNEELYYIMQALNIEDSIEDLRYDKVVIATDSDVDGLHIRTSDYFFLTFF